MGVSWLLLAVLLPRCRLHRPRRSLPWLLRSRLGPPPILEDFFQAGPAANWYCLQWVLRAVALSLDALPGETRLASLLWRRHDHVKYIYAVVFSQLYLVVRPDLLGEAASLTEEV